MCVYINCKHIRLDILPYMEYLTTSLIYGTIFSTPLIATQPEKIRKISSPAAEVLFYWWVPDSTFIQMQPHQVLSAEKMSRIFEGKPPGNDVYITNWKITMSNVEKSLFQWPFWLAMFNYQRVEFFAEHALATHPWFHEHRGSDSPEFHRQIHFPRHNPKEWAAGDKKTSLAPWLEECGALNWL